MRASGAEARIRRQATEAAARQVIAVVRETKQSTVYMVQLVNATNDVITDVRIWPSLKYQEEQWADVHTLSHASPVVPFVLSGQTAEIQGQFRVPNETGTSWLPDHFGVALDVAEIRLVMTWRDSNGQYWYRENLYEPRAASERVAHQEPPRHVTQRPEISE